MPTYRIMIEGNEYTVEVPNPHERPVRAIVNGETIHVYVDKDALTTYSEVDKPTLVESHDDGASVLQRPLFQETTAEKTGSTYDVKSPLPGIIISISVAEGDRVENGQELCVLEAMKMNNPIRSTVKGRVSKIYVYIGQQVQHGIPLMTIEE